MYLHNRRTFCEDKLIKFDLPSREDLGGTGPEALKPDVAVPISFKSNWTMCLRIVAYSPRSSIDPSCMIVADQRRVRRPKYRKANPATVATAPRVSAFSIPTFQPWIFLSPGGSNDPIVLGIVR